MQHTLSEVTQRTVTLLNIVLLSQGTPQNIDPSSMKHASTVGGASRAGTVSTLLPGTYRTLACENVSSDR